MRTRPRGGFATLPRPWKVTLDTRSPPARRFLVRIVADHFYLGFPAAQPSPRLWKLLARRAPPEGLLGQTLRLWPRHRDPELEQLLGALGDHWTRLAAGAPGLPPAPPPLHPVAMDRRAGRTVVIFGDGPSPLLVAKLPRGGQERLEAETRALALAPRGVAPRHLGTVGAARVQEGLDGRPGRVRPLEVDGAPRLEWPAHLDELSAGLSSLARETRRRCAATELREPIERALADAPVRAATRRALDAAWRDVARLEACVLRHGDTSPQNCLYRGDRLAGLIDWESAVFEGAPGFDLLNAAVAHLFCSLGLVGWSEEVAAAGFRGAWEGSPFGREARSSFRLLAADAGVPESSLESLEVAFFGVGLGRRLILPGPFVSGVRAWAAMLATACGQER